MKINVFNLNFRCTIHTYFIIFWLRFFGSEEAFFVNKLCLPTDIIFLRNNNWNKKSLEAANPNFLNCCEIYGENIFNLTKEYYEMQNGSVAQLMLMSMKISAVSSVRRNQLDQCLAKTGFNSQLLNTAAIQPKWIWGSTIFLLIVNRSSN